MAKIVLVLGESGTGKSTSMRNFKEGELALLNVAGKPLPFRGKFNSISSCNYRELSKFLKSAKEDVIVIDDAQYIMSMQYMNRIKENGWDKFNEIQSDFYNLIEDAVSLPDEKIVYFLSHIQTNEDGRQKIKTIGKMLDEKITIEGLFSIVLKTYVSDGQYYFLTQNSGSDTVKSPMGMFPTLAIDNDLKYVDAKIRNYYYMDGSKSDEEMAVEDEKVSTSVDPNEKKSRRNRRTSTPVEETTEEVKTEEPVKRRRRTAKPVEEVNDVEMATTDEEAMTDEDFEAMKRDVKPTRRQRKTRTENVDTKTEDEAAFEKAVEEHAEKVEDETPVRKRRRRRTTNEVSNEETF